MSSQLKFHIRDLSLDMSIGAYEHEMLHHQPVVVNVTATIDPPNDWMTENLDDWVCYATAVRAIRALAAQGHIKLVETFASVIADELMKEPRILDIIVRVEKTQAIAAARSVGVELFRTRD